MRVHRSAHARHYTVLPNAMLQYRQLSYTARGLLADLLSRPDGWREDGRHMADTSPQGRGAIRKTLKELTDADFYRVEKIRMPDGTIVSEIHVYDTPQLPPPPGPTRPASGEPTTGDADALSKNRYKEPSLPTAPVSSETATDEVADAPGGREEDRQETKDAPALPDETHDKSLPQVSAMRANESSSQSRARAVVLPLSRIGAPGEVSTSVGTQK